MSSPEYVLDLVKNLGGTKEAFYLNHQLLDQLKDLESDIKAVLGIKVRNTGLEECLQRENVMCIIKDKRFRPPPEPTVLLVGDNGVVLGEEIVPSNKEEIERKEKVIYLSEEFVVYPNVKSKAKEYFLMPPISFPEVENIDGIKNVVSCSPSAPGDIAIRKVHGLEDNPELASILLGFDIEDE